uniref:Uncharacterized protein n=1 Tax=Octopus bimaculoides TaxID=37653 RepID=A0A0L8HDJ4_OCTBM
MAGDSFEEWKHVIWFCRQQFIFAMIAAGCFALEKFDSDDLFLACCECIY